MSKKLLFSFIFIFIIAFIVVGLTINNEKTVQTSGKFSALSNKKISFGVKRGKDHSQPKIDVEAVKVLNASGDIYMGNANNKVVYLTFDQGYEAGYTSKILDVLKENNVKATFFITGYYLNKETDLVKRILSEGHIVGNHTINHPSMPDITEEKMKEEIQGLHTAVFEKTGYEMGYFRPPKGEFSEHSTAVVKSLGYKSVLWSLAYDDWDENKQRKRRIWKIKNIRQHTPRSSYFITRNIKRQFRNIRWNNKKNKRNGIRIQKPRRI